MEFETVREAAERLGVTVRAIQKWAVAGKLPGAVKQGRDWHIPKNVGRPYKVETKEFKPYTALINAEFSAGECLDYIGGIDDEDFRNLSLGEYCFYSGETAKAAIIAEGYLDSLNPWLRITAALTCAFANLARGHINLAKFAMGINS